MARHLALLLLASTSLIACGPGGGSGEDAGILGIVVMCPTDPIPADEAEIFFEAVGGRPDYSFSCTLDGESVPCVSGAGFPSITVGEHTLVVSVTDHVGMDAGSFVATATSRPCEFEVDSTGPRVVAQFQAMSAGAIPASGTVVFAVSGSSAGIRYDCNVNGVETVGCTSPVAYGPLTNGATYDFRVVANDLVTGAVGPEAHLVGTVDTVGPTLSITSPADNAVVGVNSAIPFRFESNGDSMTCDDNGTSFACSAGLDDDLGPLITTGGAHTITITSVDALGNPTTSVIHLAVDATGPSPVTFTRTPSASVCPSSDTNSRILIAGTDAAPYAATALTFRCQVDGNVFPCVQLTSTTAALEWSGLATGTRNIRVVAIDRFGNEGPVQADQSIGIVTTIDVQACP